MEQAKERLVSLDAFRGATIAGMILVNNAGDWGHVYRQLGHASWDGCTLTDLIFPFFVFIMGVAIPLAFSRRKEGEAVSGPILRRTALLFGFGVFLSAFPFIEKLIHPLRIPGVLQRIALCYLVAAPLTLKLGSRALLGITLALLVGYGVALQLGGDLTPDGNLGARIDRAILGTHLYKGGTWDPEGLFSTLPAIATALSGVLAGRWLQETQRSSHERASGLFVAGVACVAVGFAWNSWQPINKQLWSSSYVFFTTGLALQALAASYWVIDIHGVQAWAKPFISFGRNAIFVYMASHLLARFLVYGCEGKKWIYGKMFAESTNVTSLLYAVAYVSIWWAVVAVMDKKKLYFKV